MGCGTCRMGLRKGQTDLTLRLTGLPKYDSFFKELERPLHKVQKAQQCLSEKLLCFQESVGLYPHLPLSTFLDAAIAMLLCYAVSGAGRLDAVTVSEEAPYLVVDVKRLEGEYRHIPERWDKLMAVAAQVRSRLEGLTPIITAAANDVTSKCQLRSA